MSKLTDKDLLVQRIRDLNPFLCISFDSDLRPRITRKGEEIDDPGVIGACYYVEGKLVKKIEWVSYGSNQFKYVSRVVSELELEVFLSQHYFPTREGDLIKLRDLKGE